MSIEGYDSEEEKSFTSYDYDPSWSEIEDAISNMEIDGVSGLYLSPEEDDADYMVIGGGESGKFLVAVEILQGDKCGCYTLINNSNSESNEEVTMIVCTQVSTYSSRICVDLETVLKAAKTYAELGI
jgi:hypothetical protein